MLSVKFKAGNLKVLSVWVENDQPMGTWIWEGVPHEGPIPQKAYSLFMECERENKRLTMDVRNA